jgi:hypothetical protein
MDANPLEFVRKESFIGGSPMKSRTAKRSINDKVNIDMPKDQDSDDDDLLDKKKVGMNDMDFIDELETVYVDANDEIS